MRKKDDEKQQNIKQAVIKLILEQGFHGTSISKIAREAGVSPATVYVYYDNKEAMLQDIYLEYGEKAHAYMFSRINWDMSGAQLIDCLIRTYYNYILEYGEAFYFIEQFSSCPALVNHCQENRELFKINGLLDDLKRRKIIKNVNNVTIIAILFTPVKSVIMKLHNQKPDAAETILTEMIELIQDALLV